MVDAVGEFDIKFRVKATQYARKVRNVLFAIGKDKVDSEEVLRTAGNINRAIYETLNEHVERHFRLLKALRGIKEADPNFVTEFDDEIEAIGDSEELTREIAIEMLRKMYVSVFGKVRIVDGKFEVVDKITIRVTHLTGSYEVEVSEGEQSEESLEEIEAVQE